MYTNFHAKPISFDHSNMAKITAHYRFCNLRQISITWAILHQMWIKLETNLFEYIHKTYIHSNHLLKVISWIYPTQINPTLITNQLSIQSTYSKQLCIFVPFNQLICTQIKWSTRDIPWLAHDHPTCKLQLNYLQTIKYIQWITNNLNLTLVCCSTFGLHSICHGIGIMIIT